LQSGLAFVMLVSMNAGSTLNLCRRALATLGLLSLPLAAQATTVLPPDFDQLVNESDFVVRAQVESLRSEYRDGPQGRLIITFVKLRVRETIVGQAPASIELEVLGGRIGDDQLIVNGAPLFRPGDDDYLFVAGNGKNFFPLFALGHGRYPIHRDALSGREYVTRANDVPLQDIAEVRLPLSTGPAAQFQQRVVPSSAALTPAEFSARIKSAVRSDYVRQNLR
jgi:hypothetical protein